MYTGTAALYHDGDGQKIKCTHFKKFLKQFMLAAPVKLAVEEEVAGLDVTVDDVMLVNVLQRDQKIAHVITHLGYTETTSHVILKQDLFNEGN